jgi:aspartate carbamoyltransferase regulatory subunit
MKHHVQINVSKSPSDGGIIACKVIPIKNRYLRKLIGDVDRITVIIPGDTVNDITIREVKEGGGGGNGSKSTFITRTEQ